jgi:hypothetical protein
MSYIIGAVSVKYELPPIKFVKTTLISLLNIQKKEISDLDEKFTFRTTKFQNQRYPAIKNHSQLHQRISMMYREIDDFESAFEGIELISYTTEKNILILTYQYNSLTDTVFAYFKKSKSMENIGVSIIPGSGINQSSDIFYENDLEYNYQSNIDDIAIEYGDCYILVKPNEDFLAVHNGKAKIGENYFVNYLLNKGGSYSAYYLIQSLALSKYLKHRYNEFFVVGLSQGGLAALINSLQSEPSKAIIASGFSVRSDGLYGGAHNQIIIPGLSKIYNLDNIESIISKSTTEFLFTWGFNEKGIYGKKARDSTLMYLKNFNNVTTAVHHEGHTYHEHSIKSFL